MTLLAAGEYTEADMRALAACAVGEFPPEAYARDDDESLMVKPAVYEWADERTEADMQALEDCALAVCARDDDDGSPMVKPAVDDAAAAP